VERGSVLHAITHDYATWNHGVNYMRLRERDRCDNPESSRSGPRTRRIPRRTWWSASTSPAPRLDLSPWRWSPSSPRWTSATSATSPRSATRGGRCPPQDSRWPAGELAVSPRSATRGGRCPARGERLAVTSPSSSLPGALDGTHVLEDQLGGGGRVATSTRPGTVGCSPIAAGAGDQLEALDRGARRAGGGVPAGRRRRTGRQGLGARRGSAAAGRRSRRRPIAAAAVVAFLAQTGRTRRSAISPMAVATSTRGDASSDALDGAHVLGTAKISPGGAPDERGDHGPQPTQRGCPRGERICSGGHRGVRLVRSGAGLAAAARRRWRATTQRGGGARTGPARARRRRAARRSPGLSHVGSQRGCSTSCKCICRRGYEC